MYSKITNALKLQRWLLLPSLLFILHVMHNSVPLSLLDAGSGSSSGMWPGATLHVVWRSLRARGLRTFLGSPFPIRRKREGCLKQTKWKSCIEHIVSKWMLLLFLVSCLRSNLVFEHAVISEIMRVHSFELSMQMNCQGVTLVVFEYCFLSPNLVIGVKKIFLSEGKECKPRSWTLASDIFPKLQVALPKWFEL